MKATDLMLGNWVAGAENAFPPSIVIALEPGMVHLDLRENPDDERNIVGVPITMVLLNELGKIEDQKFTIILGEKRVLFSIFKFNNGFKLRYQRDDFSPLLELSFVHELQNFLSMPGFEIYECVRKINSSKEKLQFAV